MGFQWAAAAELELGGGVPEDDDMDLEEQGPTKVVQETVRTDCCGCCYYPAPLKRTLVAPGPRFDAHH